MTKRQLVKWLEAKQSDAKAEVEIQYATAEKAYFAQRDEALKINETVDEVFRLISEADTVANRWKEALEKVEGIDTTPLPILLAFARSFSYPKISPPCGASSIKNGGKCRADKM